MLNWHFHEWKENYWDLLKLSSYYPKLHSLAFLRSQCSLRLSSWETRIFRDLVFFTKPALGDILLKALPGKEQCPHNNWAVWDKTETGFHPGALVSLPYSLTHSAFLFHSDGQKKRRGIGEEEKRYKISFGRGRQAEA